jgi:UDP-glucose 4-epimerase
MKVFITGIKGFMGSHLSHYLVNNGHEVMGIDNDFHSCKLEPKGIVINADIRDMHKMSTLIIGFEPDVIVHLAAQIHVDYSIQHPQETLDINVSGTLNVLEIARALNIKKTIIASTSEAYGSSQCKYMDENHPLDAQSPYGASKVAADRLAKSYIDTYGMNIVVIRNFNAFGPYQNDGSYGSVIAKFAKAATHNVDLRIFGDGKQSRDYMYIDDIIQAYDFAISKLPAGTYNFGTGVAHTINKVANKIIDHMGSKSRVVHVADRAGEVRRLCCDISKVKKYGFKPITNFNRDLKKYLDWYKENN